MKAENLNNATEKHQAVLSVKINKGNKGETCLTFWYYMTRSVNHALKVKIERAGIAATATKIVSKFHKSKSNKTDNCNVEDVITTLQADIDWWLPAEADFDCGESPYQVTHFLQQRHVNIYTPSFFNKKYNLQMYANDN